jgi:flagellar hook-length control protein FliK
MTASLETETASARRVLLDHLPALRDRLAEQNIRIERFDVDVQRDGGGPQGDPRASQQQHGQRQPQEQQSSRRLAAVRETTVSSPRSAPAAPPRTNDQGINLIA